MGRIFWENLDIPIPQNCYVNKADGRVFYMYRNDKNKRLRVTVGKAASMTTMYPNERFRYEYPDLWNQYYGKQELREHQMHLGLYAATLGIGYMTGLYPLLVQGIGPMYANAIMDYSMFCIRSRSNTTQLFEDLMHDELLFSKDYHTDSWYSDFFAHKLNINSIYNFRSQWLNHCYESGVDKVWLCIDGSNNDCVIQKSDKVELGNAKSHGSGTTISYIWAVSAKDGKPVTWSIDNGGMVDSKAIDEIIQLLAASNIKIEGVILDRGFCTQEVFDLIHAHNLQYVIMLKSSTTACNVMMQRYSETIRWKLPYIIKSTGIFGITDQLKTFQNSEREDTIGLYFDGVNGSERSVCLIKKVVDAAEDLRKQIAQGDRNIQIPQPMRRYLRIERNEQNQLSVEYNYDAWQKATDSKGFSAIACSMKLSAKEIHDLYELRDVSEKQFTILKSQLGYSTTRVHSDNSIESKMAIAFIASIIRSEIQLACDKLGYATNKSIQNLYRIVSDLLPNNQYASIKNQSKKHKKLLACFGIEEMHFPLLAQEINQRSNPIVNQIRTIPEVDPQARKKQGRPRKEQPVDAPKEPKKLGRPKGSKNKKTLERERLMANQPAPEKPKIGRPKGSKNKKTLEREALLAEEARKEARKGKGPGRPKGSKNKKTLEREALASGHTKTESRKATGLDQLKQGGGTEAIVTESPKNADGNKISLRKNYKEPVG